MFDDSFKRIYKDAPIVVWSDNSKNNIVDRHNHAEIEISLVESGRCDITINDKKIAVMSGDMSFKNPFELHSTEKYDGDYFGYCMCFDVSLIADENVAAAIKTQDMRLVNYIPSDCKDMPEIKRLFMDVVECYKNGGEYVHLEIKARISLLFAFLLNNGYISTSQKKTKDEIFYKRVFGYISQNYNCNITSKDAADALSYNHSYFCRKFKNSFGRRFYDYLNMFRIFESQKLFVQEEKTITQIAAESGFNSQTYFTECFKHYMGILPSEYKQMSKPDLKSKRNKD